MANVGKDRDILSWCKYNSCAYPILSRMARDVLSIPATSCSIERKFFLSKYAEGEYPNSLSPEAFRATMFLKLHGLGSPTDVLNAMRKINWY